MYLFLLKLYFVYTKFVFHPVKFSRDFFISKSIVILHNLENIVREVDFHKKWCIKTSQIEIFVIFLSRFTNVTVKLQKNRKYCAFFPPRLYFVLQRWTVQFHQNPFGWRRNLPMGRSDLSWMGVRRKTGTAVSACKARIGRGGWALSLLPIWNFSCGSNVRFIIIWRKEHWKF